MKAQLGFVIFIFFIYSLSALAQKHQLQAIDSLALNHSNVQTKSSTVGSDHATKIMFQLSELEFLDTNGFKKISIDKLAKTTKEGLPELPYHSVVLSATPENVDISLKMGPPVNFANIKVWPAQEPKCRCKKDKKRTFKFEPSVYRNYKYVPYKKVFLGYYRGEPRTKLMFYPTEYSVKDSNLVVYPNMSFTVNYKESKQPKSRSLYDYLVLAPQKYHTLIHQWSNWKSASQGIKFKVVATESINMNTSDITTFIQSEYHANKFKYALLVGDENSLPMHRRATYFDPETPTDLPYFTMDGSGDLIPDVFYGRVIAQNEIEMKNVLKKWKAFEAQWRSDEFHAVGVASNEGDDPSDNQYVRGIGKTLQDVGAQRVSHFYQGNVYTNRKFNSTLSNATSWITYMGHGSGTDWSSFYRPYSVDNIKELQNHSSRKAIWIDVACQNGRFLSGRAGERLINEIDSDGNSIGVAAYFGGTVDISWHPPAILATGIANALKDAPSGVTLGELLRVGYNHLSNNSSDVNDLKDNYTWYHLQGDPSMQVKFK